MTTECIGCSHNYIFNYMGNCMLDKVCMFVGCCFYNFVLEKWWRVIRLVARHHQKIQILSSVKLQNTSLPELSLRLSKLYLPKTCYRASEEYPISCHPRILRCSRLVERIMCAVWKCLLTKSIIMLSLRFGFTSLRAKKVPRLYFLTSWEGSSA